MNWDNFPFKAKELLWERAKISHDSRRHDLLSSAGFLSHKYIFIFTEFKFSYPIGVLYLILLISHLYSVLQAR